MHQFNKLRVTMSQAYDRYDTAVIIGMQKSYLHFTVSIISSLLDVMLLNRETTKYTTFPSIYSWLLTFKRHK